MKKCKITKVGTVVMNPKYNNSFSLEGWEFDGTGNPAIETRFAGEWLIAGYTVEDLYIISKVVEWRKEEEQRDICQTRLT